MNQGRKIISINDAKALTEWFNKLVEEKSGIVESYSVTVDQEKAYIKSLSKDIYDGKLLCLLSYVNGKIVARIDIKKMPRSVDEHMAEVSFGVLKENESYGIELIGYSQNIAKTMGICGLMYYILETNTYFSRIFQISGFTKIGVVPNFYKIEDSFINRVIYFKWVAD